MDQRFEKWFPLRDLSVSHLPRWGDCPAVYVMRDSVTGEILKYGHTGCLRTRIVGNYLAGYGGATTQRIHEQLMKAGMIERVEIASMVTDDAAEAERREKELRATYKKACGQRPSWQRMD